MWLSVAQLAGLLNISIQAVHKARSSGKYSTARPLAETKNRARGGKVWEISAYDPPIPPSVRQQLGLEATTEERINTLKEANRMSVDPTLIQDDKTARRLRALRRAQETPADVKVLDWYKTICREENVSLPTLYRWIADAERGKVVSDRAPLAVALKVESGPVKIEVKSRSFAPQALEYGMSLLVRNPMMDIKHAYDELSAEASRSNWELGSLNSFYRAVKQLPEAVSVLARSGKRGLEAIAKPPIKRDMTNVRVYDILIGDQHIFDYIVLDDEGQPIRPQMFAWVDAKSRYFSGICPVMGDYDQYAVGIALRGACRYGIPKSLYNDWGKQEGSKYIEQLRRQLAGKTVFH